MLKLRKLDRGHFSHGCGFRIPLRKIFHHHAPRFLYAARELLVARAQNGQAGRICDQQPGEFVIVTLYDQPELASNTIDAREGSGRVGIGLRPFPPFLHLLGRRAFARVRSGLGSTKFGEGPDFQALNLALVLGGESLSLRFF